MTLPLGWLASRKGAVCPKAATGLVTIQQKSWTDGTSAHALAVLSEADVWLIDLPTRPGC